MPDDWFSPVLQFLSTALWPIALIITVALFRKPIGRFIDEISEFTGFGTNAMRSGILQSEELRDRAQKGGEDESDVNEPLDNQINEDRHGITAKSDPELLTVVGRQIDRNLRWAQQNCNAASSTVCAEIVRSTYTDLRLGVRVVGYRLGGSEAISGKNLEHVSPQIILERVGAPADLIELVSKARTFSLQVRRHELQVNDQAARNFIESLIDINQGLFRWSEEAAAGRSRSDE